VRVIDFHNHYYPPAYIAALRKGPSTVRITEDNEGNPVLHYPGDYNVAVRGHRDIAYRDEVLGEEGVDLQVVSLTTPGTHVETPDRALELAALVNDDFAEVVRTRRRFNALATLPLNDPKASARELERALTQLKLPGAMLFSNVNGAMLSEEQFWPIYEVANEHAAILHIHPTNPANVDQMQNYWLMPLVGFLFDTTLAAASLTFAGVPQRFPRIKWVLSHLGGAIPYLAERLDRGYHAFRECRQNIDRKPSDFLKQFYFDTVNFDSEALMLAARFAGSDHILAGSDYPHAIGSIPQMKEAIDSMRLSVAERAAIRHENAARLLRM
jgi:aminocarboxymuconate-semialdehyde decarboxylase